MAGHIQRCAEMWSRLQPWEEAKPNQTSVPFEKEYFIRDTQSPILKQNVGMFRLKNGVEVHFQSFGIFNVSLWDDMIEKFKPLTKKDILFVGEALLLSIMAALHQRTRSMLTSLPPQLFA